MERVVKPTAIAVGFLLWPAVREPKARGEQGTSRPVATGTEVANHPDKWSIGQEPDVQLAQVNRGGDETFRDNRTSSPSKGIW